LFQGKILLEARERFPDNIGFGKWRSGKFPQLKKDTASNQMNEARLFQHKPPEALKHINKSIRYRLSAPINSEIEEELYGMCMAMDSKPTGAQFDEMVASFDPDYKPPTPEEEEEEGGEEEDGGEENINTNPVPVLMTLSEREEAVSARETMVEVRELLVSDEENKLANPVDGLLVKEVKLIMGCLHPDRHETVDPERLAKAFDAFKRVYGR